MTKQLRLLTHSKSPILIVGLFCLLLLIGCDKDTNPDDVTIEFWTALTENDLHDAAYYSTEESVQLFNQDLRNASLQIGKVRYDCDGATVETRIVRESAGTSSVFKTFLVRDQEQDRWKVDYPRTIENIDRAADKRFKNIITSTAETGKLVKEKVKFSDFFKQLWQAIVTVFKNLKDRLLT